MINNKPRAALGSKRCGMEKVGARSMGVDGGVEKIEGQRTFRASGPERV